MSISLLLELELENLQNEHRKEHHVLIANIVLLAFYLVPYFYFHLLCILISSICRMDELF